MTWVQDRPQGLLLRPLKSVREIQAGQISLHSLISNTGLSKTFSRVRWWSCNLWRWLMTTIVMHRDWVIIIFYTQERAPTLYCHDWTNKILSARAGIKIIINFPDWSPRFERGFVFCSFVIPPQTTRKFQLKYFLSRT